MLKPKTELMAGVAVLEALLAGQGFPILLETEGQSSGGGSCSDDLLRGARRLECYSRYSLV